MTTQHTQQTKNRSYFCSNRGIKAMVLSGAVLTVGTLGGCNNAGEGLFSGAALGAVTGLAIGSLSGNAGEGAALGAMIGGAGGAIVGDQNERNRENAMYGSYQNRNSSRYRSSHPYCSTHRVYHIHRSHRSDHRGGYHYDEWWND